MWLSIVHTHVGVNRRRHWFKLYNKDQFHQSLGNLIPDEVYHDLPHPLRGGGLMSPAIYRLIAYQFSQAVQPMGSTATREFFGVSLDEVVTSDQFLGFVHPDAREMIRQALQAAV